MLETNQIINKTSSVQNHHQRAALHWCKGTEITLEPLFPRRKIDVRFFGSLVPCFPPTLESYFRNSEALGLTIEFPVCLASKIFPIEYTNGIKREHKKNISILGSYIVV